MSTPSTVPNQPTMAMTAPAPPPAENVPFYKTAYGIAIISVASLTVLVCILCLIFRGRSVPQAQVREFFQNMGGEF